MSWHFKGLHVIHLRLKKYFTSISTITRISVFSAFFCHSFTFFSSFCDYPFLCSLNASPLFALSSIFLFNLYKGADAARWDDTLHCNRHNQQTQHGTHSASLYEPIRSVLDIFTLVPAWCEEFKDRREGDFKVWKCVLKLLTCFIRQHYARQQSHALWPWTWVTTWTQTHNTFSTWHRHRTLQHLWTALWQTGPGIHGILLKWAPVYHIYFVFVRWIAVSHVNAFHWLVLQTANLETHNGYCASADNEMLTSDNISGLLPFSLTFTFI